MINKIDHINIVVSDLEKTTNFFLDLGFKQIAGGKLEGSWIDSIVNLENVEAKYVALEINDCPTKIELIQYISPAGELDPKIGIANQLGFRHIAFEVTDIETEIEKLKNKNVDLFSEMKVYPANGKKLIYFYGPDNIILEYAEYKK